MTTLERPTQRRGATQTRSEGQHTGQFSTDALSLSVTALREYASLAATPGHIRRAKQARHLLLMHVAKGIGSGR